MHLSRTISVSLTMLFAVCLLAAQTGGSSPKKKGGAAGAAGKSGTKPGGAAANGKAPKPTPTPEPNTTPAKPIDPGTDVKAEGTKPAAPADGAKDTTGTKKAAGPDGQGQGSSNVCRAVKLGPATTAASLQSQLNDAGGVTLKAAGGQELVMCGPPANVDLLAEIAQSLSASGVRAGSHQTHLVRLFYFRNAQEIAGAITGSGGLGTPVKPLGNDLLVFTSESEADDQAIRELKHWVAMIDVPRPQVSLSAWSIQISSKNLQSIQDESANIKALVSVFNQELQDALQQGWRYLASDKAALDQNFTNYLTGRYVRRTQNPPICPGENERSPSPCPSPTPIANECQSGYCLGYTRMFSPIQPSLTNMLIALVSAEASADKSAKNPADKFVDCLESLDTCEDKDKNLTHGKKGIAGVSDAKLAETAGKQELQINGLQKKLALVTGPDDCERRDLALYAEQKPHDGQGNTNLYPTFNCFRRKLHESLTYEPSRKLLRLALADFLFHYKMAELYPQDFIPWNRGASAQRLDNLFGPLLTEFNRDLAVYLRVLGDNITARRARDKKIEYSSEGLVTVAVLSGTAANVSTTTQSFITTPPVISAREFLNAAAKSSGDSSLPTLLSSNLTPMAAESLLALVQSVEAKTAQVGRDLVFNVTANSLSGASSAELDIQLDSTEHAEPRFFDENNKANSSDNSDNVSRVATHNTKTKVRVDSLKLFEVSSFSATLTHGRTVPLLPPFIDLPYLGNLARLRLPPGTVYHRSFAIVSAVIVPTAADIANAIEFRSDLEENYLPKAEWLEVKPAKEGEPKDDKGVSKKATTSTTTVQVQQSGDTETPVNLQIGCCSCPKCTAPAVSGTVQGTNTKKEEVKPESAGYYWIVTHYREGISVSQPHQGFLSGKEPVHLAWTAPVNSLSFDVYWLPTSDYETVRRQDARPLKAFRITKFSVRGRTFDDYGVADRKAPPNEDMPTDTVIYSPIPTQPGNLNEFHEAELTCIEEKGIQGKGSPCPVQLNRMPVTRFSAAH